MFETGLQYVRADFHLHTRQDKEFLYNGEENSYIKDYVDALKKANIHVGVITNHNKFNKDEYKAIHKAAKKQDIFILPGVELTVKEGANGIHTLIVFNPDEWLEDGNNHIQTFITTAFATISNPENSNAKSVYDLKSALEKLEEYGRDYFIIFAHVDQNSGLFGECDGGLLESLSMIPLFKKRVLGLQKSRTYDNRLAFEKCFEYLPALVEGSDPKSLSDIGKGKITYLKIGEYSFSNIKFALQDYKDRVSDIIPDNKHGYISSISFQGGKFDGQTITFSPQLNTLIGIRGSGKSSVLESIKYVLDINSRVATDKEYKNNLIKNFFGSGGKATLTVIDKHGNKYHISRILGEKTNVVNEKGDIINISPTRLLDGVQYFGQQDLSNSTNSEIGLMEELVRKKFIARSDVDKCADELFTIAERLINMSTIPSQKAEVSTQKTEIEHKLSIFKEKGIDEKLKKLGGSTSDVAKIEIINKSINEVLSEFQNARIKSFVAADLLNEYHSDFNNDLFVEVTNILSLIDNQIKQIRNCFDQIQQQGSKIHNIYDSLIERNNGLADEFAAIKREIKEETLDVDNYAQMKADLEKIKQMLKQLEDEISTKSETEALFSKAVKERNDTLLMMYKVYKDEIELINKSQNDLKIEIIFKGDREGFKSQMKTDFKGTGILDAKYQVLSDEFSDYVSLVEDWLIHDGEKIRKIVSANVYTKLDERLRSIYGMLLSNQVNNKVNIYYHGKLLRNHSIGQRASALILFLLTQDNNDVIFIDQPEDDLDNKVIYDEVISAIIQKKPYMQFIFATHNANIPVLGDAERVFTVEFQDTNINVSQGNIDNQTTHEHIVNIMEGGKAAFDKRKLVYNSWK